MIALATEMGRQVEKNKAHKEQVLQNYTSRASPRSLRATICVESGLFRAAPGYIPWTYSYGSVKKPYSKMALSALRLPGHKCASLII